MKRHTKQSKKQKKGQFFTSNASELLKKYAHLVEGKDIIDPFAGDCDLLKWATENNAKSVVSYDIEPKTPDTEKRDSLLNPPDFEGKFLLTNPPYLCSNKNKDKKVYDKWGYNDLYKCHIASFVRAKKINEGILILPSNFLSEGRAKIRDSFFQNYEITICDYYYYQVFPNATTGIVVFHFQKAKEDTTRTFDCFIHYSPEEIIKEKITLEKKYDWLWGKEFFDYIEIGKMKIEKYEGKKIPKECFLSNIVVGLLDKGKWQQGLSYNEDEPIVCGEKAFTTYQLILPFEVSIEDQKKIIKMFNEKMSYFRKKYHGLFLSNYMGATQKIYSRDFIHSLISKIMKNELNVFPAKRREGEGWVFRTRMLRFFRKEAYFMDKI